MTDTNELRKLLAAATPLPWYGKWNISTAHGDLIASTDVSLASDPEESDANGDLIVAAVNALPALLDELDAVRADLREAISLLGQAWSEGAGDATWIRETQALLAKHKETKQ
jgi:hypothetical protein